MGGRAILPAGGSSAEPPDPFQPIGSAPEVTFRTHQIPPPSPLYIRRDDQMLIRVLSDGSVFPGFTVRYRLMLAGGRVQAGEQFVTTPAVGVSDTIVQLAEGFLLDVTVLTAQAATQVASFFVQVSIVRGVAGQLVPCALLVSDYIQGSFLIGWPGNTPVLPTRQQGSMLRRNIATPGAGVDFTFTVPPNVRMRIQSLTFLLTTAVAVATRDVRLVIDDGAVLVAQYPAAFTQLASLAGQYTTGGGFPGLNTNNDNQIPLPENLWLPPGFRIRSLTANLQALDTFTLINMLNETVTQGF